MNVDPTNTLGTREKRGKAMTDIKEILHDHHAPMPMSVEAQKLAMFERILFALETVVIDVGQAGVYWDRMQQIVDEARAIGAK